jgi:fumarate hydratase class II
MEVKRQAFDGIIKCGRTHLMDATPLSIGKRASRSRSSLLPDGGETSGESDCPAIPGAV